MRNLRRSGAAPSRLWLAVLLACVAGAPTAASAQEARPRGWAIVPFLGFGVVRDGPSWNSAGMEAAIELEYGSTDWRWNGYTGVKGLGVGCSESCFTGGPALAVGASRSLGPLWVGGGFGALKQFGSWRSLPFGRISLDRAPLRFELRVEFPQQTGVGVYFPLLVGIPID